MYCPEDFQLTAVASSKKQRQFNYEALSRARCSASAASVRSPGYVGGGGAAAAPSAGGLDSAARSRRRVRIPGELAAGAAAAVAAVPARLKMGSATHLAARFPRRRRVKLRARQLADVVRRRRLRARVRKARKALAVVPHRGARAAALGERLADPAEWLLALAAAMAEVGARRAAVHVIPVAGSVARADGGLGARHRNRAAHARRVHRARQRPSRRRARRVVDVASSSSCIGAAALLAEPTAARCAAAASCRAWNWRPGFSS